MQPQDLQSSEAGWQKRRVVESTWRNRRTRLQAGFARRERDWQTSHFCANGYHERTAARSSERYALRDKPTLVIDRSLWARALRWWGCAARSLVRSRSDGLFLVLFS